jgi:diguanylate cyclase (GGDEF)-like protein
LKELARKMESTVLPPHAIARIGGEEFAILLHEPNPEKAIEKAEELHRFLLSSEWESIKITVSMGITHYQNGDTPNSIYIRADDALYISKRNGRKRLTVR